MPSLVVASASGADTTFSTLLWHGGTPQAWWVGTFCSKTVSRLCFAVEVTMVFLPSLESLSVSSDSLMLPLNLAFAETITACLDDSSSTSTLPPLTFLPDFFGFSSSSSSFCFLLWLFFFFFFSSFLLLFFFFFFSSFLLWLFLFFGFLFLLRCGCCLQL